MLNPDKCTFDVSSGKLLGYLVSQCASKQIKPQEGQGYRRYAVSTQSQRSPETSWNDGSPKSIRIQVRQMRYAIL